MKPILQGLIGVCVVGLPVGSFLGNRVGRWHSRQAQDRRDLRRIGR